MNPPVNTPAPFDTSPALSRRLLWAVLLGGIALAVALAAAIAWRNGAFERMTRVYVLAESGASLAPGTHVRMSGVRIGEVHAIALQADQKVRIDLRIQAAHAAALRADAQVLLVREQLRPAVLEVKPGSAIQPLDPANPQLGFHSRGTMTEMADELRGRLLPILDDFKQLTGALRARQGDVQDVLQHAATASGELAKAAAEMHALTAAARGQLNGIAQQAQGLLGQGQGLLGQGQQSVAKISSLLDQVNSSLNVLNTGLPGLMARSGETLENLNAVARDTRAISSAAAEVLPGVLRSAAPVMDDARELVQGVKGSWPARALLPAPPGAELPIESHDAQALRSPPR